ncbi:uncharacterized protein BO97DRAFT_378424 [Aspergillus homomorphus CBS 101889]|uniref:Uncharacterized protein n=1 Tax=Aspergillus homomorphus (strain CBS 101889) TaxID=1450537 RepID=A0A395HHV3_ASPHC|nr:hypothetical protein BO97DRAFT_378424 [Aspergillus homomorphus CBS 101889]RAL07471.1 hypothetical protein BO97DRAFT_378424 [Aspergillus homomorphus CBS 101889]
MALQPGCANINHGKKRPAETDPDHDQPLTKRFSHLHLNSLAYHHDTSDRQRLATSSQGEKMILDDTKHTLYIHDLERELAEVEILDNQLTILPALADTLSTVPRMLVTEDSARCTELVLYTEPVSLTVPRGIDDVQKALIATRERARQAHKEHFNSPSETRVATRFGVKSTIDNNQVCFGETMEIDVNN